MALPIQLYRRAVRLEIAGPGFSTGVPNPLAILSIANVDDDGLRIAFDITRTNEPEPDQATFRIWGLAQTTRDQLTEIMRTFDQLFVKILAGYAGLLEVVYFGEVWNLKHKREGDSIVTTIGTGDGQSAYRDGRVSETFVAGVPVDTVRKLAEAGLGLAPGADGEAAFAQALAGSNVVGGFQNGFVATGKASDTLTDIGAAVGVKWWIRDGKIVYVPATQATIDAAIVLNPNTGLLQNTDPQEYGDIEFTALLNPRIFPGRQVVIQDSLGVPVKGTPHRVDVVQYTGDTHGSEWYAKAKAAHARTLP